MRSCDITQEWSRQRGREALWGWSIWQSIKAVCLLLVFWYWCDSAVTLVELAMLHLSAQSGQTFSIQKVFYLISHASGESFDVTRCQKKNTKHCINHLFSDLMSPEKDCIILQAQLHPRSMAYGLAQFSYPTGVLGVKESLGHSAFLYQAFLKRLVLLQGRCQHQNLQFCFQA